MGTYIPLDGLFNITLLIACVLQSGSQGIHFTPSVLL